MADLVTRLKLDDKNFNNNIKKSKKQINDFGKTCQAVGKGISKAFVVFTAIKATIDSFSFAINSSSKAAKAFSTTVDTAKTTVSNFFGSLMSGDWTPFKKGLKESINLANEFAESMYMANQSNESGTYYADYLEGRRNQLEHIITSDNSSDEEKKNAQSEYAAIAAKEEVVRQGIINSNLKAINDGLKSKGIEQEYTIDELMQLMHYVNTTANELTKEENAFRDLLNANDFKSMFSAIITNTDKMGTLKKDWDDSITDVREKTANPQKGSIAYLDKQISAKEDEYDNATTSFDRAKINTEIEALKKEKHWIELEPKITAGLQLEPASIGNITNSINDELKNIKLEPIPVEVQLPEQPSKWALDLNTSFQLAGSAIQAVGSAFAQFSDNAALGKSALILGAIGQLVFSYATAAAKTMSPWEWVAFAISGAATLATVIGQLSSYASGGIVDSPYTTGDRNLVRVNGGEMILTKGQQSNLFSMLNNGTSNSGNGEVKFKISGKELVGVLNNYSNKVSKVR